MVFMFLSLIFLLACWAACWVFLPLKYFIKLLLDLSSCQPTGNMCLHKDPSTYPCPNVETLTYVDDHIVYCEMAGLSTPGLWAHRRKSCGDPAYRCVPTHHTGLSETPKEAQMQLLSTITHSVQPIKNIHIYFAAD